MTRLIRVAAIHPHTQSISILDLFTWRHPLCSSDLIPNSSVTSFSQELARTTSQVDITPPLIHAPPSCDVIPCGSTTNSTIRPAGATAVSMIILHCEHLLCTQGQFPIPLAIRHHFRSCSSESDADSRWALTPVSPLPSQKGWGMALRQGKIKALRERVTKLLKPYDYKARERT